MGNLLKKIETKNIDEYTTLKTHKTLSEQDCCVKRPVMFNNEYIYCILTLNIIVKFILTFSIFNENFLYYRRNIVINTYHEYG